MDGREYELTSELVRARVRGHTPESIRQYSVEIDGVHWPVKHMLRLATGAEVPQSQFARRQLERLGFRVDGAAVPRAMNSAIGHRGDASTTFDLNALLTLDSVDVRVAFDWH